ncbi:MAG: AzlD domain-containing protein, partial [Acidimicrobiales bacterium]
MIVALGRLNISARVEQSLRLVAPAVLAALVVQTLILEDGEIRGWTIWYPAAAVAALVAWRTKSTGWTLLGGFATVWALAAVF